jgi:hypothetical protein
LTLPACNTCPGKVFFIENIITGNHSLAIIPNGTNGDFLEGNAGPTPTDLNTTNQTLAIISDGANPGTWRIFVPTAFATAPFLTTTYSQGIIGIAWSGTAIAPNNGGTGTLTAPTSGQIPIGTSGGIYTPATVSAGSSKITVTPGSGTLSLDVNQANLSLGSIGGTASLSSQVTGTLSATNGGTGQTSTAAAYNALSPMTTLGDIEYESAASTASRLAGNTTATKKFLTQTGTGSVSAAPGWNTIANGDLPSITGSNIASGTITSSNISASAGITGSQLASSTITGSNIAAGTVALTNIATQAATTFVGNSTGSSASPTALSVASAQTMLGYGSTGYNLKSYGITASGNQLPTSGSIGPGPYWHFGNWTQTGNLTIASGTRIYMNGTPTFNGSAITVSPHLTGGEGTGTGTLTAAITVLAPQNGAGLGYSGGNGLLTTACGPAGAGFGGLGGHGGSTVANQFYWGGQTYSWQDQFSGSSAMGGSTTALANYGGTGGQGGGSLYWECTGAFNAPSGNPSGFITANGGAGGAFTTTGTGGPGGSGGAVCIVSGTSINLGTSTSAITVTGGAGASASSTSFGSPGGGGGGYIVLNSAGTITQSLTAAAACGGGAAGTGGSSTTPAAAGGNGQIISNPSITPVSLF